jgi:hypothetical protein
LAVATGSTAAFFFRFSVIRLRFSVGAEHP